MTSPVRKRDRHSPGDGVGAISQLDYTVIFARDLARTRRFFEEVLRFPPRHETRQWVELRIGSTRLALTQRGGVYDDPPHSAGPAYHLTFRVARPEVDRCADELSRARIPFAFGTAGYPSLHRTLFFRDPDGNVIEMYCEA
jgi:catechol-2,3-dioxygenase